MTPSKNFDARVREECLKDHYHRLGEVRDDCEKCARFKAGARWARSETIREAADIAYDFDLRCNAKIRALDPHQEDNASCEICPKCGVLSFARDNILECHNAKCLWAWSPKREEK